jgi:uncharacterized sporulation protein YeaH/YhbH (DUF444 family)
MSEKNTLELVEQLIRERDEARAALTDDTRLAEWEKRGVVDSAVIAKLREARAEVARLRKDPLPALAMMRDIERTVAEKQREACAKVAYLYADLNYDSDTVEAKVRATPLVTEEKP